MLFAFIFWFNIILGFTNSLKDPIPQNPLHGYSIHAIQRGHGMDIIALEPVDTEEDSEDSDDQIDPALGEKSITTTLIPNLKTVDLQIFEYSDRLSKAHIIPIHTPPDTYAMI